MSIKIINMRDEQPNQAFDFKIDSCSDLGNPFMMATERDRDKVCNEYDIWFQHAVVEGNNKEAQCLANMILESFKKYGRVRLFCWCNPKRCHGLTIEAWLLGQVR